MEIFFSFFFGDFEERVVEKFIEHDFRPASKGVFKYNSVGSWTR